MSSGKMIAMAFVLTITALGTAIIVPEFFNSVISTQTGDNPQLYGAMRALIAVTIILIVGIVVSVATESNNA